MLDEIGEVKNVRAYIENRLKNKAVIWGPGVVRVFLTVSLLMINKKKAIQV
ncbi:hypothetical protein BSPWISOXPB_2407 [uncultured Gammaproteobacteria bacterium]|nr:hypothetical protein BSPWISOXPB_2407 [uncultured Gammaproteobacteria bacterium]